VEEVTIAGVGKFSMEQGCKAYSDPIALQTNRIVVSNETSKPGDFPSQVPLQYECCEELGVNLKLFDFLVGTPYKKVFTHFDDFKYASKKVSDLEKETKEQEWRNHHLIRHSIIMFVLISLFLLYVVYKVIHCIRRRRSSLPCFRMMSNSQGEPPALMASSGPGQTVNTHIQASNESLASSPEDRSQGDNPSHSTYTPRVAKTYF
jgi:hypothetical protein